MKQRRTTQPAKGARDGRATERAKKGSTGPERSAGRTQSGATRPKAGRADGAARPKAGRSDGTARPKAGRGDGTARPKAGRNESAARTKAAGPGGAARPKARRGERTLDASSRGDRRATGSGPRGPAPADARGSAKKSARRPTSAARPFTLEPRTAARPDAEPREPRGLRPPPQPLTVVSPEPGPGMWILTTRLGAERDVVDELLLAKVVEPGPRVLGPALVLSPKLPKREGLPIELAFARQGFQIVTAVRSHDLEEQVTRIARSVRGQLGNAERYALHVWVPDSDEGNALSSLADELEARLAVRLTELIPEATRVDDAALRRLGSLPLIQVCLIDAAHAVAGVGHSNRSISLARGGRTRVRVTGDFPSRAARKVEEALAWLGDAPGPSELCVDLGAAPGGWTYMLLKRRARVIAVDPALLKPEVAAMKGVTHRKESAFEFTPDEPVDWLFCDMAWRPLEAAALLAKWGRRRWARMLVANVKLPMTRKAEMVARVRDILVSEGQWKNVRVKQLYHDREEVTIVAHLG